MSRPWDYEPLMTPVLIRMADVHPRPISWLWPGRIALGRITLLVGTPGAGKSFLTTDMAARITRGTPWPDGSECPMGSVLLLSAEDDPADTIRPRLDAHGADPNKVVVLRGVVSVDSDTECLPTLANIDPIRAALEELPDCRLMVVDPVGSFLGGGTDAHRDNEVRSVLAPIAKLAEEHGPAVLVVCHRRKSAGGTADDTALGSRAFTGIARSVWHLSQDKDNEERRLLVSGKNNLARRGDGLAFRIGGEPARIEWEPEPVPLSADDALAAESAPRKPGPRPETAQKAVAWLRRALAGGPRPGKELVEEWSESEGGSRKTLERAKNDLGVKPYRETVPGPWLWRLPPKPSIPKTTKDNELGYLGHLANSSENMPICAAANTKTPKMAKFSEFGNLGDDSWGEV